MRALTYHGAEDVRVETVADPIIQEPDDIILRVTATAICGSDLHLYRGKIPKTEHGDIFGHEFMGIVEEVGPAVTQVKKGDRVIVPFVIACGECFFCQLDLTAACETTNTGRGAIINKNRFHRVQLYLAIVIFTAVYRAGKQNMCVCQKPIKDLLKCPAHCQMKKCFS